MTIQINLLSNALEYYDTHNKKYNKILKKAVRQSFEETIGDIQRPRIILYDKDNKKILTAEYQHIGIYYKLFNLWAWGWALPLFKKNETSLSRKILNYGLDLETDDDILMGFLRAELVTSRFKILKKTQLDVHLALAGYLTKQPIIYKYKSLLDNTDPNNHVIYYVSLINIELS